MAKDTVTILLESVAAGKVSITDARKALEGVELDEDTYQTAVDHGVFNQAEAGTIVNASLAPSGASGLVVALFLWGIFWVIYWVAGMLYGLLNGKSWDQQQLAFHLAMTFLTLMIMGIVYMKWVLPDLIIVKHRRNKYIPEHPKDWVEYEV